MSHCPFIYHLVDIFKQTAYSDMFICAGFGVILFGRKEYRQISRISCHISHIPPFQFDVTEKAAGPGLLTAPTDFSAHVSVAL